MGNHDALKRIHQIINNIEIQLDEVKQLISTIQTAEGIDQDEIFVDAMAVDDSELKPKAKPEKAINKAMTLTKEQRKFERIEGRFRAQQWAQEEIKRQQERKDFEESRKLKRDK
jgi:hypothetical protein